MARNLFKEYNIGQDDNLSNPQMINNSSKNLFKENNIPQYENMSELGKFVDDSNKPFNNKWENRDEVNEFAKTFLGVAGTYLAPKAIKPFIPLVKKGIQYLQPAKKAESLMQELGDGSQTAEENIGQLGKLISKSRANAEEKALIPKEKLYETEKDSDIFSHKRSRTEHFIPLDKQLGEIPKPKQYGEYLNTEGVTSSYGKGLKKIHNDFSKNTILENSDYLRSALSKEIRDLQSRQRMKTLDSTGKEKLEQFIENKNALIKDQKEFFKTLPKEKQGLHEEYNKSWEENVGPYENAGGAIRKMSKGRSLGIKPTQVSSKFSFPTQDVEKVLKDIGQSGRNKVIFNELQKVAPGDTEAMVKALQNLQRIKGYQGYITPEIKSMEQQLANQLKTKNYLSTIGSGLAGGVAGGALGHPVIGALVGLGGKHLKPALEKALQRWHKK